MADDGEDYSGEIYAGINFIHNHPPRTIRRDTTLREQKPSPWDNTGSQKPHPQDIKLENFTMYL